MQSSKRIVAGVDEVGRGPLAGPVLACAFIMLAKLSLAKLRDSKHLSQRQRNEWYKFFKQHPDVAWGIGRVSERVIDRINIYEATQLAMERAVKNLEQKLHTSKLYRCTLLRDSTSHLKLLIIDGITKIKTTIPQQTVIKGDEQIALCAAASIVAKVTRDRLMLRYHARYPMYRFDRHKGYGTQFHLEMLKKHGPCAIHRRTFARMKLNNK